MSASAPAPTYSASKASPVALLILLLPVVGLAAACAVLLGTPGRLFAGALVGLVAVGLTLYDIRIGLGLFALLTGLSPELSIGPLTDLRLEDLLFPVLLVAWVLQRRTGEPRPGFATPLTAPMVALLLWSLVVTVLGIGLGTVPSPVGAFFRLVKYAEYYLIFFLVYNNVTSTRDARGLALAVVLAAAVTGLYGIATGHTGGDGELRATGPLGEAYNIFAGYLNQGVAVAVALALASRSGRWRLLLGAAALALVVSVLYTHSREGYVMLAAVLGVLGTRGFRVLLLVGVVLVFLGPVVLPRQFQARISDTVIKIQNSRTDSPGGNSLTARYYAWRYRWNGWFVRHPIQGNGVGSIPFSVDNQYLLVLVEVGVVGFALFLWLLARVGLLLARTSRELRGTFAGVLVMGVLAALIGMLVQGMAATNFVAIRTSEMFWFLMGLAMAAARLSAAVGHVPAPAITWVSRPNPERSSWRL